MTKKVLSKRVSAIATLAVAPALLLLGGCGSSKHNTTPVQQAVVSQIIGASSPGLTVNTQSGSLPSSNSNGAAAPTASVLSVSPVNGGGSQVVLSVTTPQPVDEILIGVPNTQGFYDVVVNPANATRSKQVTVATPTTTGTTGSTTYQVTLVTTGSAASSLGSLIVETRTGGVVSQATTVSMVLTAPAAPSRVIYELSDLASGNSVIAYRNDGSGNLSLIGSYPDGGTGVQGLESVGPDASGALTLNFFHDKDNPVVSNPQHTLMFVANQGSDNISVMRIASDGSVSPVPGSPFASNGRAPVSVAVVNNGNTLVVVNKNQLAAAATQPVTAVNELCAPGPNVSSFNISSTGSLSSPVSKIALPVGSLPTEVLAAPTSLTTNGSVV
ncbi:MAG: hypothetical protein M3Y56_15780, partial [Armatimonadota bacterium]|nr:hypothetical protein [Armatimonadota bacterium]